MQDLPVLRPRSGARIAGVCAALARAWQVEPIIVRAALVVLTVATNGVALLAYGLLWALIPKEDAPSARAVRLTDGPMGMFVAVLVLGLVAVVGMTTGTGPGAVVVLVAIWILLRFGMARRTVAPASPLPARERSEFERLTEVWEQRLDNVAAGRPADWTPDFVSYERLDLVPSVAELTEASRRRSLRTWVGIMAALGVAWGGLAITGQVTGQEVSPLAFAGATLLVLGAALVWVARPAAAAHGRPPLLLLTTLLAAAMTVPMMLPHALPPQRVGVVRPAPPEDATLPPGENVIDLGASPLQVDRTVSLNQSAGELTLQVPAGTNVVVHAGVGLGSVVVPDGPEFTNRITWDQHGSPDAPTLTVYAEVDFGTIEVETTP